MEQLWQDYLFLTNEIEKFVMRKELDMVNELLGQREKVQQAIQDSPAKGFSSSVQGQKLLLQIADKNRGITQILQLLHNRSKTNQSVANAYNRFGMSNVGFRMDSKT